MPYKAGSEPNCDNDVNIHELLKGRTINAVNTEFIPVESEKYGPNANVGFEYAKNYYKKGKSDPRLIYQRPENNGAYVDSNVNPAVYHDYEALYKSKKWAEAPCESLPSTHELYILYTSGTTGTPKGVVRDAGGTAVGLNFCMKNVFDLLKWTL